MDIDKLKRPQGNRASPDGQDDPSLAAAEDRRRIIKLALASAPVVWTLTARSAHAIHPENARALERMNQGKYIRPTSTNDDQHKSEDGYDAEKKDDLQLNAVAPSRCSATHSPIGDCNPV